jgi:hypothetical protein
MEMEVQNTFKVTGNASPRRTCHLSSESVFSCGEVTGKELQTVTKELKDMTAKSERIQWCLQFVEKDGDMKCVFPYTEKRICLAFMADLIQCSTKSIRNHKNQEIKKEKPESN